MDIGLRLCKRL